MDQHRSLLRFLVFRFKPIPTGYRSFEQIKNLKDFRELPLTNEPEDELGSNLDEDNAPIGRLEDIQRFMPVQ